MPKKLLIIAGEASGDSHSASLIAALKKLHPDLEISGIGGEKMRRAGCRTIYDISELSIIGFTDVLKNFHKIKDVFNTLLEWIDAQNPQAVILVDYPGFNLKLAREIKKRGIPVIYYISPQIWAWWKGRIKTIKRYVDKMIVVFKFEEKLYRDYGVDVSFVGHPLLDMSPPAGSSPQKQVIGLMPGSRKTEVARILPVLLQSARIIHQKLPQFQFMILKSPSVPNSIYTTVIARYATGLSLRAPIKNRGEAISTYDFLQACDFALVASGTATLETAIMQKPMAVVYKVSFLNWAIARCLIKLPYIGLVNVVAGKKIIPEFIQFKARPRLIAERVLAILGNPEELARIKSDLGRVRESLGTPGASRRAAELISPQLKSQHH